MEFHSSEQGSKFTPAIEKQAGNRTFCDKTEDWAGIWRAEEDKESGVGEVIDN